jgi:hypothetical protein
MEEGSANELNEPQKYTVRKKHRTSAGDGINAVISYVGCSTNRELQAYYEHLRNVKEILLKEQQPQSFQ